MRNLTVYQKFFCACTVSDSQILSAFQHLPHAAYLQNHGHPIIGLFAEEYFLSKNGQLIHAEAAGQNEYSERQIAHLPELQFHKTAIDSSTGFTGGWMGFIGYGYAAGQKISLKNNNQPLLFMGNFSTYLRKTSEGWFFCSSHTDAKQQFNMLKNCLNASQSALNLTLASPCAARWSKQAYVSAFQHVQEYIKAGDCYQINLTQEFTAQAQGSLLAAAAAIWQLTDAPYSGYLRIGDFELLSCSPELFIDFKPERKIITKPIKGTMPRFEDPILDEQSEQRLKSSEKDMAENVMIVDLMRNDLSVYAETGSVKTPKLFDIESFNQVHHMVSEVEAVLKTDVNPFEVLISALPGGSITGAPKVRAMQIIEELEGAPRGAYCGSMGYFNHDGTGSWNILIRSIQKYQNQVSLWAGGGITIASDCDAEYQECFDKVEAMLDLLNTWYKPE